mmetsp:Transcript_12619/g.38047  ORF Transcript_12619/g.38047 Transcript_12619/m.38047 type:complete len:261 (-) Transcript_12619:92-874(-)
MPRARAGTGAATATAEGAARTKSTAPTVAGIATAIATARRRTVIGAMSGPERARIATVVTTRTATKIRRRGRTQGMIERKRRTKTRTRIASRVAIETVARIEKTTAAAVREIGTRTRSESTAVVLANLLGRARTVTRAESETAATTASRRSQRRHRRRRRSRTSVEGKRSAQSAASHGVGRHRRRAPAVPGRRRSARPKRHLRHKVAAARQRQRRTLMEVMLAESAKAKRAVAKARPMQPVPVVMEAAVTGREAHRTKVP